MIEILKYKWLNTNPENGVLSVDEFSKVVEESELPYIFRRHHPQVDGDTVHTVAFYKNLDYDMSEILERIFGDAAVKDWKEKPNLFKTTNGYVMFNGKPIGSLFTKRRFLKELKDARLAIKRGAVIRILNDFVSNPVMNGSIFERGRFIIADMEETDPDIPQRWNFFFGAVYSYFDKVWIDSNGEFGYSVMENSPEESFRLNIAQLRLLTDTCEEVKKAFNNKEK